MDKKVMSEQQVERLFKNGQPMVIGEFRLFRAEQIGWREKGSGVAKKGIAIRMTLECGDRAISVSSFAPDTVQTVEAAECAFKKGDRVAVLMTQMQTERGAADIRGEVVLVTANGSTTSGPKVAPGQ